MRTVNPRDIRKDFVSGLDDIEKTFCAVRDATTTRDNTLRQVAEGCFLTAAILWEGFISDLFIAYIAKDSCSFEKFIRKGIAITVKKESEREHSKSLPFAEIKLPKTFSSIQIRKIVDSNDYNLTFGSVRKMCIQAFHWLAPAHKKGFQTINHNARQKAFLALVRTIRNFLAHRSESANKEMRLALKDSQLPPMLRRDGNSVSSVGAYMVATPDDASQQRLLVFIEELRLISHQLCPG